MYRTILAAVFVAAGLGTGSVRAVSIQVLAPGGSLFGEALGIDGNNVVGTTGSVGFLYDGSAYTKIFYPGSTETSANGISGNKIVGDYRSGGLRHGFVFDGSAYTPLDHPLGTKGTYAFGVSGNNVVGEYIDASNKAHGFLYDGTTWSTLDFPKAAGTIARGVDGGNVVGLYADASSKLHSFLYDGTTWTTVQDSLFTTTAYDVSGSQIVGQNSANSGIINFGFLYDGSTFNYPLSIGFSGFIDGKFAGGNAWFGYKYYGISGNKIVGSYHDQFYGLERPFILTIPEPSSFLLASLAGAGLLFFIRRQRSRASPR